VFLNDAKISNLIYAKKTPQQNAFLARENDIQS